ncbi:hypothetical protein RD792_016469 [Penstemon davidsonii]|uniref:Transcriptional elongation regulator MINIYO n=1 Tax=Penstemon davidsonii TaxID=160366 RepID=A0ABR0CJI6_9LAMI|nr:hypothetical protein RD792_016469 [Penstemon davidsonii]
MKKVSSGGNKNPKPPKTKPLGATLLGMNENDAAGLIGGIVEKGFSETMLPSAPQPSVLPFPVARHRSHAPHWAPKVKNFNVNNYGDGDDVDGEGDREDFDGMDLAANVANPVPRKEKKGLDFGKWQEKMKINGNSGLSEKKNETERTSHGGHAKEQSMTVNNKVSAVSEEIKEQSRGSLYNIGSRKEIHTVSEIERKPISHMDSSFAARKLVGEEDGGIESQIDSENRARLLQMSADEIAEAQAEIMAKLNPELINALKKRAQAKVKRQKFSDSEQSEKNLSTVTADSDRTSSHDSVKNVAGEAQTEEGNKASVNTGKENCSLWDAWSKRVESVRGLRFSLDGSVINSDFAHVSDSGSASSQSGYSEDNVSKRDFLRTEGDPGASGYTIKEAIALTRSVVPGQRTLALHLLASVLDRAIVSICRNQVEPEGSVDWEAIWAFTLGPEPELVFSLRMCLDDNHNSVVHACAKAIQCVLSCEMNEYIFDISEKTPTYLGDVCTAPVFRSKPDINAGFLRGGFWKYNTKPSNIVVSDESDKPEGEGERTIKDDIVVAGQDTASGLVRMEILPRICHLLETDPAASLEESLISILIALARHSPECAAAIVNCERLVQTIANRFTLKQQTEINPCKIKSVTLLKVLARVDKKSCLKFIKNGLFQKVTWHLYRYPFSLDQWLKSGKEACKLTSALLIEQLRLWKVCLQYGYCLSEFSDIFTTLCVWLSVPTIDKLINNNVMNEYCAITKESYLLLDVLAGKLPNFYSKGTPQDSNACSWSHFGTTIDLALEWMNVKGIHSLQDSELNSLLWVISSVFNMLSSMLKAVIPENNSSLQWLPDFVPKIGLQIIKNGYLRFSGFSENGSLVEYLCNLRLKNEQELAISSTCCLQGLVQVVASVDKLINLANLEPSKYQSLSSEDKILANGILKYSVVEVRDMLTSFMRLITNEWQCMQPIEIFSRGGLAPGVGVGWGAPGGGYWSLKTLLAQQDTILLNHLLQISEIPSAIDALEAEEVGYTMQRINCVLAACIIVGPGNSSVIDRLLSFIFQAPVLKYLDMGIRQFLNLRKGSKFFLWNYEKDEFFSFSNVLATHFKNRWLNIKKKQKPASQNNSKRGRNSLETIHEDTEESTSLIHEWAHQRLHLPAHWFLSAISTVHFKETDMEEPLDFLEVSKGGLFFLLGIEAIPTFLTSECSSPVQWVPVVWKLHALSVVLLSGMGVLEDEKSRDVYETLQNVYGEILDEKKLSTVKSLQFESDIHQNYSTFIEALVDQFAAESYGDEVFGRQIAIYLYGSVEASVRLAAWNALSNARVLELLPPLTKCFTKAEGYLEPIEDDEKILEAYVKSWVSGALEKAANRGSMTLSLVLHHLSSFIFGNVAGEKLSLRNKLTKSLLRDYSRKQQHKGMMVKLICYKKHDTIMKQPLTEVEKRLQLLKEICEGNSSLVTAVEDLETFVRKDLN